MSKFRKKPVVIDAVQFTEEMLWDYLLNQKPMPKGCEFHHATYDSEDRRIYDYTVQIPTLEGDHRVQVGDWIITGVNGEHYPCKPDIFEKTYEPAS